MYILGAHLISTYSGKRYTEFVKERIWDPLNMSYTTFSPTEACKDGLLTQSWTANGRRIPAWFPDDMVELIAGAGGIISNVVDMVQCAHLPFSSLY
jgi:CubicO group peptidase (beta-lactamase class C family)